MALTNSERQARYRDRLKQLAAKGVMSPLQVKTLADTRHRLREWRYSLALIAAGQMKLTTNNIDTTAEHAKVVMGWISKSEALLANFDPAGFTKDGNIEIGNVTPEE